MGYRDEKQALRARVAQLEGELDEAQERIGRLSGDEGPEEKKESYSRFLGARTAIVRKQVFDFELTDQGFEDLAALWRSRFGEGAQISQVGRTLTMRAVGIVTVTVKEGQTTLELDGNLKGWSAMLGLTTPGLSVLALGAIASIAQQIALSPAHVVWLAPLAIILSYLVLRELWGRLAMKQRRDLGGAFAALVERIEAQSPAARGARISAEHGEVAAGQREIEQEALAEQEALEVDSAQTGQVLSK